MSEQDWEYISEEDFGSEEDLGSRAEDRSELKKGVIIFAVFFAIDGVLFWAFSGFRRSSIRYAIMQAGISFLIFYVAAVLVHFEYGNARVERKLDAVLKSIDAIKRNPPRE